MTKSQLDHKLTLIRDVILTNLQGKKDLLKISSRQQREAYFDQLSTELFNTFQDSIHSIHLKTFVTENCRDILAQDWFWIDSPK